MTALVHDPVSRARYSFAPDGENLLVDCWIEPGGWLPAHVHPHQTEHRSVVQGTTRGEMLVAPGTKHGLESAGEEAHLRCVVVPALRLQAFLEESAAAAREGLFTRRGLPRGLRGARWAARFLKKYRGETVMVSPPPLVQRALIGLLARGA